MLNSLDRRSASLFAVCLLASIASCGPPAEEGKTPAPAVSVAATATAAPVDAGVAEAPLPLDARVRKGKLQNGMTYYVLPHKKPEHRAQVWLAVNAGSVLEDDDQRGLAHFVEHMGFNGTKRFPKQALVDMLEKSGVSFGADLNAYTSFDETVYTLQVPTDKPEIMNGAIGILRDWTDSVTFDPAEVEKERGVVMEEWRLGRGAGARIFDKQAPVFFFGSKYADRLTIGKPEIIQGAPRDTLFRFYKDWYRPDLMAVIAVGDFSADEMEARIKTEFSTVKPADKPRPRPSVPVPAHERQLVTVETDKEATGTSVSIITKFPHRPLTTASDYRRTLGERLFNTMLNARLDELRRKANAPFLYAGSRSGSFVRTEDSFTQGAQVKENGVRRGYTALLEEMLRVERFGFTASELTRAKSDVMRSFEQAVKERDTEEGRSLAREIVRNFLEDEAMPGPEAERELATRMLPSFTLEELNSVGKSLGKNSRVVAVTGPATMEKPTEAAILAATAEVAARDIKPYEDIASNVPLMATPPIPGAVVSTREIAELGVTEWTLANGARVVVKATDFKADEVRLSAFAKGGTSLAADADFDTARFAGSVVSQGGVGSFDAVALRKILAGKVVHASAQIGELEESVSAGASTADLTTMFQLVNLRFTAPRRDDSAFAAWKESETEAARNRRLSPEGVFWEDLSLFSSQNHKRRQPVTPELIAKVDLDRALSFYKARFSDASGFTFIIVGNVDVAATKTLVETYIGSLPSTERKETWRDVHVNRPPGVAKKEVAMGTEPKSRVTLTFHGDETFTRDKENDMRMLGEVLRIRLREVMREDMGGVYGVSAGGSIARWPRPQYTFNVSFGCAPTNVAKLEKALFDEVKAIAEKGIGDDYIAKVKELRRREHETNLRENGYWMGELSRAYTFGDDPKQMLDFNAMVDKVTSDHVRAAAKKYLSQKQYILGELKPATTP